MGNCVNKQFIDKCEILDIRVLYTAAENPFSTGICESNHAVIDESARRKLAD